MIESIFDGLRDIGAVTSGTDFSEEWLGMEGSYFRGLKAKQRHPSAKALANCAVRLKKRARMLEVSTYPQVRVAATRYQMLADQCLDGLMAVCDAQDNRYAR